MQINYRKYKRFRNKMIGFNKYKFWGYILLFLSIIFILNFSTSIIDKSVFVSGYTRSNGVHVSSYFRTPPGSSGHNSDMKILIILFIVILIYSLVLLYKSSEYYDSFTDPMIIDKMITSKYKQIDVDISQIAFYGYKSRKIWECDFCHKNIPYNKQVWSFNKQLPYNKRKHQCNNCKETLPQKIIKDLLEELLRTNKSHLYEVREIYNLKMGYSFSNDNDFYTLFIKKHILEPNKDFLFLIKYLDKN